MKDIIDKLKAFFKNLGEKIKPLGEKIKGLTEKLKPLWEKIVAFVKEQKRYIGVAGLFVVLVLVLYFFTGADFNAERIAKINSIEVSGEDYVPDAEFEIDAYPEVNELIKEYFAAYVACDLNTLETLVNPLSEKEKSYIFIMSHFYEEYQNIKCYTKHGLSKDSYIVSACFDIKFKDQDVTAPSMVLFYVQTNENGELYINNLYSDFNMKYSELAINKEVYTALRKYTTQEDYLELFNQVESDFNKLIKENKEIYQLTKRTIPGTRQMWEDSVYYVESTEDEGATESTEGAGNAVPSETPAPSQTPAPSETPAPSQTPAPSETPAPSQTPTPSETPAPVVQKVKVQANLNVRVRSGAGTNFNKIGDANNGDVFVKLGVVTGSDGKEWTKIQFNATTVGYIRSDFLVPVT